MTEELVEAVANVLTECRKKHRRDNDGRLAKEGMWPDPHSTPTDEDLARAVIPVVLAEVQRHLSAVQYDPAPYTALKHRLADLAIQQESV